MQRRLQFDLYAVNRTIKRGVKGTDRNRHAAPTVSALKWPEGGKAPAVEDDGLRRMRLIGDAILDFEDLS